MSIRLFTRQIVTLVLALGIFLSGAAPSWAMPGMVGKGSAPTSMSMAMPDMAMQNACAPDQGTATKKAPCKNTDSSCAVCTACAVPVVLLQQTSPVRLILHGQEAVFPQDVNRNGIAVLPALPPPILLS
jgi:hypothetical protein